MEGIILPIAKKLANQVPELLVKEIKFLYNVSNEVKSLVEKLEKIGSELKRADVMADREEEFDRWVSKLRNLAFKAEDVIEVFIHNETPCDDCNVLQLITGCFYQLIILHKLHNEINDIDGKLAKLSKEKPEIRERNPENGESSTRFRERGGALSETEVDDVVGFQKEARQLESWLTCTEEKTLGGHVIVSICAQGGAGKSSLAQKIYKSSLIKNQFNCVAWVSVSQECHVKDKLQEILEQEGKLTEELRTVDIDILQKKVKACLKDKDYLIILDDVWTQKDFEAFIEAFPKSRDKKCRVLLTTRIEEVGGVATHLLKLPLLENEEAMELFLKTVYRFSRHEIPSVSDEKKHCARKILSEAKGLPIAIVLLGGSLSSKRNNIVEWKKLSDRVHSVLLNSGDIQKVLSLSYIELPYHLRSCFLYFGIFPEDSLIDCDKLVRLWLAEGILEQQGDNDAMEDVAEQCLEGLIQRSMVQVVECRSNGNPQTLRTHDLIRELAIRKAEKANFSRISDEQHVVSVEGIRRIALHPKNAQKIPGTSTVTLQSEASISSNHPQSLLQSSRIKSRFEGDDDLVGFQEEVNEVATSLTNEEPLGKLAVVYIVGGDGRGKTAIARKVYNNVKSHFHYHAWVHAPDPFWEAREFLCPVLEQVTMLPNEELKCKEVEELRCMLQKLLEGKSFLIVLDTQFTNYGWEVIENVFPKTFPNQKCRILCCISDEGKICSNADVSSIRVQLHNLNEDLCMKLFLKTIFKCSQDEIPEASLSKEMIDIAREMVVKYCEGFPGAILSLGSLLSRKAKDVSVWKDMLESLKQNGQSYFDARDKVFLMCFLDLPNHLKRCTCYLICLRFGTGVESNILIQEWAEQGLLKSGDKKTIEDVGRDCIRALIQRNLLDVIKWGLNGEPQTCIPVSGFHWFLRDSLSDCESYMRSKNNHWGLGEGNDPPAYDHPQDSEVHGMRSTTPPHHSQPKTFSLSHILSCFGDFFKFSNHVYSLLCFSKNPQVGFEQFPLLRVVDLQGAETMEKAPNEIRNLTLLRYLSLRGTRVRVIPRWIGCLRNLQTLDAPTSKIPIEVLDLRQLRYLFADSFYGPSSATNSRSYSPESSTSAAAPRLCVDIGVLEHLHTLELHTAHCIISGLDKLTNIRVLWLHGGDDSMFRAIAAVLTSLKSLSLTLSWTRANARRVHLLFSNHSHESHLDELILEGTKTEIPRLKVNDFLPHLTYLWLETYVANDVDPFSTLQRLLFLRKLCLRLFTANSGHIKSQMTCSKDGFPNLHYFYISVDFRITKSEVHWMVEQGALRNLRVLHIEGNQSLNKLPHGLRHVTTLKELILTRCYDVRGHLVRRKGYSWWNEVKDMRSLSIKYLDESNMRP